MAEKCVQRYVSPSVTTPDIPLSGQAQADERAFVGGTLAASMERLARTVVTALPAPAAMLVLLGNDRRSFIHGTIAKPWMAHDSGALVRSGILGLTVENGGRLSLADAHASDLDPALRDAARELEVASLACVVVSRDDGVLLGALCAFDDAPRFWTERDLTLLEEFGRIASMELQLRRALSERDVKERQLRYHSMHDPLTGLPNRALFMKRLAEASSRARRGDSGMYSVLFLDLDDFKLVNDSMGHHVGDEVLVMVARRLEECIRGGDLVARLGGDEFAVLLERVSDARDSVAIAERIQQSLKSPMDIGGYRHVVSASIGIVQSTTASEQPEYLLRSADMAMYRAKNNGRARFEMFDRAMHAEALTRLQVEHDLRDAVGREAFFLEFQPIVALQSGRVSGVEALIRWRHPERGPVAPLEFIPVAEETGLIIPIGRWVLREACRQVREWQRAIPGNEHLTLSLNLSVREFAQADLVPCVQQALRDFQLDPRSLCIEVTESAIIDQAHPALITIGELRALGVQIHLDDFGTGYSALSYLHRLSMDAVKVDRAFTTGIESEERPLQVVRSIVSLVHAIGMRVVAEGVTSADQVELLRSMGCDYGQGFWFAKPLNGSALGELLREGRRW